MVVYPIQHGKMINLVAYTAQHDLENTTFDGPWSSVIDKSVFASYFASWEPEVQALIDVRMFLLLIDLPNAYT